MYYILGKMFACILTLGVPLLAGIALGRYSSKFKTIDEFINDFFN